MYNKVMVYFEICQNKKKMRGMENGIFTGKKKIYNAYYNKCRSLDHGWM